MAGTVPSWHGRTDGHDAGTTGWTPSGLPAPPPREATGQGTPIDQLAQRLFDELATTRAALEQVHAEARAAREDAQAARAEARDAHDAAEILLNQVAEWEDAVSGVERIPEQPAGPPATPDPPAAGRSRGAGGDPLAEALTEFAAELRSAADARARGDIDARAALRLARSGFHKAHRVISRVGRDELRQGR